MVLVAALLVGVLVPLPSTNGLAKSPELQLKDLNHQITMLQTQEQTAGQTIAARTWQGSQNDVSAAILANLTAQAKQEGLAVGSFRPQRTTDLNGVTELPYAVQITGPYPGVRLMMRSLDSPGSKVVLRSAQITAATNSTTDVAATLGLSAYVATDPIILAAAATAKANDGGQQNRIRIDESQSAAAARHDLEYLITPHNRRKEPRMAVSTSLKVSRPVIYALVGALCVAGLSLPDQSRPDRHARQAPRHHENYRSHSRCRRHHRRRLQRALSRAIPAAGATHMCPAFSAPASRTPARQPPRQPHRRTRRQSGRRLDSHRRERHQRRRRAPSSKARPATASRCKKATSGTACASRASAATPSPSPTPWARPPTSASIPARQAARTPTRPPCRA